MSGEVEAERDSKEAALAAYERAFGRHDRTPPEERHWPDPDHLDGFMSGWSAALDASRREVEALRAALEPFAELADGAPADYNRVQVWVEREDIDAARRALEEGAGT